MLVIQLSKAQLKGYEHKTVKHSVKEFVNGMDHTNGIESFWALLKGVIMERITICLPGNYSGM